MWLRRLPKRKCVCRPTSSRKLPNISRDKKSGHLKHFDDGDGLFELTDDTEAVEVETWRSVFAAFATCSVSDGRQRLFAGILEQVLILDMSNDISSTSPQI